MRSDWKKVKLKEVCIRIGDGLHGTPKYSDNGAYYFINGNNLTKGKIEIKSDTKRVDENEYNKYKKELGSRTLLLSINGTIGNLAKYKNEKCILGKSAAYLNVSNEYDRDFIYYVLSSNTFQKDISTNATGTTIQNVSLEQLREFEFSLPPLPVQQQIAQILSSLDDKIELLREENKTLEAIAGTLFKRWFVDFEFLDKDGNPYKSSGGKMIESELGMIPEGWRVGKLGELVNIKNGFAFKSEEYVENGIPIVRTNNFNNKTVVLSNPVYLDFTKAKKYQSFLLEKYDYLLVMVGASIGKSVIVPSNILPALQNQNMWNFIVKESNYKFYCNLMLDIKIKEQMNSASGSAREFFRKDYFYNLDVIIPDEKIVSSFQSITLGIFERVDLNMTESSIFDNLRNRLLPKLVKGEIEL